MDYTNTLLWMAIIAVLVILMTIMIDSKKSFGCIPYVLMSIVIIAIVVVPWYKALMSRTNCIIDENGDYIYNVIELKPFGDTGHLIFCCLTLIVTGLLCAFISKSIAKFKYKKIMTEIKNDLSVALEEDTWKFPAELFYVICFRCGVKEYFPDSFTQKKLKLVMSNILNDRKIPVKYHERYLSRIEKYYNDGKKTDVKIDNGESHGVIEKAIFEDDQKTRDFNDLIKDLYGTQKRMMYITHELEECNALIEGKPIDTGELYRKLSKKKADWAIMGGIADGIAGPVAGMAVALETQKYNDEVDAYNANVLKEVEFYNKLNVILEESRENAAYRARILRKEIVRMKDMIVLDNIGTDELFNNLKISGKVKVDDYDRRLKLTVNIVNNYDPCVPDWANIVVDGTLNATLYCDGEELGNIFVPINCYGVDCNGGKTSIEIHTNRHARNINGKYTVKFSPNMLWAMEG